MEPWGRGWSVLYPEIVSISGDGALGPGVVLCARQLPQLCRVESLSRARRGSGVLWGTHGRWVHAGAQRCPGDPAWVIPNRWSTTMLLRAGEISLSRDVEQVCGINVNVCCGAQFSVDLTAVKPSLVHSHRFEKNQIRTVIQSVLFHCLVHAGTGLLQEVVYLVSQGADPDEIGLMNIDEQLPVLEYPQPGLDIIKELTSPRLIKSHLPYRFLPSDLHNGNSKVIYMARNPKDLVVSYYQFHRSLRTMSYRGTFQEFCRRFMNDKLGYGSWFEHVQEFWEHHMDANVLFLKYEDMHKDLATMVEQLVRFLGVSYDKAQLESMVEHCHQLIDQCCNAEALPVGRGRVGLWKDIFTVSMNEKFDLVYKQKMGKCDLTFDFYL
ncbi:sulfotransferase 4A1 [Cyanistes caeruleus]|nr:sulfotransferase 4A1 [Cyanistes caeruleus]